MQVVKVKKGEDMNQSKFRSKLKIIYGIIKSLNQGEYIGELQTDSLLLLAVHKPNLGCSSPATALCNWFGLSLTALPKCPTSLLTRCCWLYLVCYSSLHPPWFEFWNTCWLKIQLSKLNFSNSPLSSAVRKNHLEQISPDYGCVLRSLLLSPPNSFFFWWLLRYRTLGGGIIIAIFSNFSCGFVSANFFFHFSF